MMKKEKKNKNKNAVAPSNHSESENNKVQVTYENAFLQMNRTQKRGNKSIYLSPELHERLSRIVQVIGEDKIPLFAYLNNILDHHFRVFENMITKEFNEKHKSPFE